MASWETQAALELTSLLLLSLGAGVVGVWGHTGQSVAYCFLGVIIFFTPFQDECSKHRGHWWCDSIELMDISGAGSFGNSTVSARQSWKLRDSDHGQRPHALLAIF